MDGSNPVVTQMSLIELNGSKTKLQGLNLGKELLGVFLGMGGQGKRIIRMHSIYMLETVKEQI